MKSSDFIFQKIRNGKPHFAIINLDVEQAEFENEITENYSGEGFRSQGYIESVPYKGYDEWKIAAKNGISFVLELTNQKWRITINSIEGRIGTDTNPTIVGHAAILALANLIDLEIDDNLKKDLEDFVFQSWDNDNWNEIPNFKSLSYK